MIDDLIEFGLIIMVAVWFLRVCVIDCRNILVSGGMGLGKMMLLNVVSSFIPHKERIVMVEDIFELWLY